MTTSFGICNSCTYEKHDACDGKIENGYCVCYCRASRLNKETNG